MTMWQPSTGVWCPHSRGVERYDAMPTPIAARRRSAYSGASAPTMPIGATAIYYSDIGVYSDTGLTTLQTTNGGAVNGWADQSGNGHDLVNLGTNAVTYGTNLINGYPAVMNQTGSNSPFRCSAFTLNLPITVYMVIYPETFSNTTGFFDGIAASGYFPTTCIAGDNTSLCLETGSSFTNFCANANAAVDTAFYAICAVFDTSGSSLQVNNTAPVTSATVASANPGGITLGALGGVLPYSQNCKYAACIVYPSAHNSTLVAQAMAFLAAKY